jgi:Xaa-Pro aminopeptidase
VARKGDVMNIDFGVTANGYCSDLQRIYYVLDDGETEACAEVRAAFETLQESVRRAAAFIRPGVNGIEVDAVARDHFTARGYPGWNYALGHQVGTFAHDGGTILAPRWERYRPELVESPIEEGNVFTLEPGIATSRGYVGQEDMVLVTAKGGRLLSTPQEKIFLVR